jgi:hypothetical protein
MNLQYERMLSLCETLSLPFVAQGYAVASQEAAEKETAYSDFLEGLLRTEAAGRQVRVLYAERYSQSMRLVFPERKPLHEIAWLRRAGIVDSRPNRHRMVQSHPARRARTHHKRHVAGLGRG